MTRDAAERAVVTSALVVAIIYGYRRLEEPADQGVTIGRLLGVGNPVTFARWATAWGTVFFMLALVSEFAPGPAGAFSILVAASDVIANGKQLFGDLGKQTTGTPAATTSAGSSTAAPSGG